jgi:hypothetical protein
MVTQCQSSCGSKTVAIFGLSTFALHPPPLMAVSEEQVAPGGWSRLRLTSLPTAGNSPALAHTCNEADCSRLIRRSVRPVKKLTPDKANTSMNSTRTTLYSLLIALSIIGVLLISFIAPPLPARDIIDNIFWAIIASSILIFSVTHACQKDSLVRGIEVGIWSGFVSGLLACCMGLIIVVFGMRFILQDPLNVAE